VKHVPKKERRGIPVLINGDDILFQSCDEQLFGRWAGTIGDLGFVVEKTKTSVSQGFGTINSTLLKWREGKLVVIPTMRLGMLRKPEYPHQLGKTFRDFCRGVQPEERYDAATSFLDFHRGTIVSSRVSMLQLGFNGKLARVAARKVGLWTRERQFEREGWSIPLEPAPTPHNIIMAKADVEMVETEFLVGDLIDLQAREMASEKWRLGADMVLSKPSILRKQWYSQQDKAWDMRNPVDEGVYRYRLTPSPPRTYAEVERGLRDKWARKAPRRGLTPILRRVLDTCVLEIQEFCLGPPPYVLFLDDDPSAMMGITDSDHDWAV
jgi:hypothetical protein